jgi:putative ABC transport system permease protein
MINAADLPATGLLTPASRATHRLLVAGQHSAVREFRKQVTPRLQTYETLQSLDEGRPELNTAIDRASRFMSLATMLTVVLSGVAVGLAAYSFGQRESTEVAVLRSLGATRRMLIRRYLQRMLTLTLLATLIGCLIGFIAQALLAHVLRDWLQTTLPAAGVRPVFTGLGTALITLGGFSLPVLLRLINTPPMHILRVDAASRALNIKTTLTSITLALLLLLGWQAGDFRLATYVFLGIAAALLVLVTLAWIITLLVKRLRLGHDGGWRLGIVNLGRFSRRSALLMATFGCAFLTLTLLTSVRGDLLQAWENSVPDDAPNHFLINIQPEELQPLEAFLDSRGIEDYQLYPMIRGRLVQINTDDVSPADYASPRAQRLAAREFFLSTSETLPAANKIAAGSWFDAAGAGFSAETGIAETLGFTLGDSLTFDVAGERVTASIDSLREVRWDSMQPNFFVIAAPGLLDGLPTSYITSIRIDHEDRQFIGALVRQFPSITPLDVRTLLDQVRRVIDQASRAVEYVFLFTFLAGLVVLLAAIQTQRNDRRQEIAVLKTLGAGKQTLVKSVLAEFVLLGAGAGLLGGLLAYGVGWLLARQMFQLDYQINPLALLPGMLAGATVVGMSGYLAIRKLLETSPLQLLRHSRL